MSIGGTSTIIAGIIIFLVGHWFLGKSYGQNECNEKPQSTNVNYGGGIAGIVIGIILMITGLVINFSKNSIASSTSVGSIDTTVSDTISPPSYEDATSIS